jgi:niacin transporter
MTYAAVLTALGLVLPQVLHMTGGQAAGRLLLPMHIPVLIAGLMLGKREGVLVALFVPLLGNLFSSMPPPPVLPYMLAELACYGFFSALIMEKTHKIGVSMVSAMLIGRAVGFAAAAFTFYAFGFGMGNAAALLTTVVTGAPGIILQLIVIPPLCAVFRKVFQNEDHGNQKRTSAADCFK